MTVRLSLCGSQYDTVLYVFEGSCLSDNLVACNDDNPAACGYQSQIDLVSLQGGIPYYIVVDGYDTDAGEYTFTIDLVFFGVGSPSNPYRLSTPDHLIRIGSDPALLDKCFILMNDIDMQDYAFTTAVIAPDTDGSNDYFDGTSFTGVFDGDGHTITGPAINGGENDFLGLFGLVGDNLSNAIVKNLGVTSCTIIGSDFVGDLAGAIRGESSVWSCYATGTVVGDTCVGGLTGEEIGSVSDCYAICNVSGSRTVGGVAGMRNGNRPYRR
jgi:hypothetical protein